MASNELIVDDEYCKKMGDYFLKQGQQLDTFISQYISILKSVKQNAVKQGETADALAAYIKQAEKMNKQIGSISKSAQTYANSFVNQIDQADQFLF